MKHNILFFFCDQFLWNATGYAGHSMVKTPNLDRLAERSVNFPHTYCASPVCVPARISLFSGQYPHTHGQPTNGPVRQGTKMFIETLKENGYHTCAVGKLHFFPLYETRRFDTVSLHDGANEESGHIGYLSDIDPKLADLHLHGYPKTGTGESIFGSDISNNGKKVESIVYGTSQLSAEHFYTQWISNESMKYLEEHQDKDDPFFLYVSFCGPHSPFLVPEPYDKLYKPEEIELPETWEEDLSGKPKSQQWHRHLWGVELMTEQQLRKITALYYGHITLIDEHIGRILDKLDVLGLGDAIIAFSADHGELLGSHGLFYKGVMYDESLRIPLLIHDAGQKNNSVNENFVSQIDIMPTLLDLAGIEVPEWSQGRSMKGLLNGNRECARSEIFAEIEKVETGGYMFGCRNKDYLFSYEISKNFTDDGELYNLRLDPEQLKNLFYNQKYGKLVNEFKNKIMLWLIDKK